MKKFTEIIGAQVICAHNCAVVGVVINILFNQKRTRARYLLVSGNDDETTFLVPIERIFAINDAVIIRNRNALNVTADITIPSLLNSLVFSISGNFLGYVNEIEFDDKFYITSITTKDTSFTPKMIIGSSDGVILINDTSKKYTNGTFAPRVKIATTSDTSIVEAMGDDNNVATPRTIVARLPKNFKVPQN